MNRTTLSSISLVSSETLNLETTPLGEESLSLAAYETNLHNLLSRFRALNNGQRTTENSSHSPSEERISLLSDLNRFPPARRYSVLQGLMAETLRNARSSNEHSEILSQNLILLFQSYFSNQAELASIPPEELAHLIEQKLKQVIAQGGNIDQVVGRLDEEHFSSSLRAAHESLQAVSSLQTSSPQDLANHEHELESHLFTLAHAGLEHEALAALRLFERSLETSSLTASEKALAFRRVWSAVSSSGLNLLIGQVHTRLDISMRSLLPSDLRQVSEDEQDSGVMHRVLSHVSWDWDKTESSVLEAQGNLREERPELEALTQRFSTPEASSVSDRIERLFVLREYYESLTQGDSALQRAHLKQEIESRLREAWSHRSELRTLANNEALSISERRKAAEVLVRLEELASRSADQGGLAILARPSQENPDSSTSLAEESIDLSIYQTAEYRSLQQQGGSAASNYLEEQRRVRREEYQASLKADVESLRSLVSQDLNRTSLSSYVELVNLLASHRANSENFISFSNTEITQYLDVSFARVLVAQMVQAATGQALQSLNAQIVQENNAEQIPGFSQASRSQQNYARRGCQASQVEERGVVEAAQEELSQALQARLNQELSRGAVGVTELWAHPEELQEQAQNAFQGILTQHRALRLESQAQRFEGRRREEAFQHITEMKLVSLRQLASSGLALDRVLEGAGALSQVVLSQQVPSPLRGEGHVSASSLAEGEGDPSSTLASSRLLLSVHEILSTIDETHLSTQDKQRILEVKDEVLGQGHNSPHPLLNLRGGEIRESNLGEARELHSLSLIARSLHEMNHGRFAIAQEIISSSELNDNPYAALIREQLRLRHILPQAQVAAPYLGAALDSVYNVLAQEGNSEAFANVSRNAHGRVIRFQSQVLELLQNAQANNVEGAVALLLQSNEYKNDEMLRQIFRGNSEQSRQFQAYIHAISRDNIVPEEVHRLSLEFGTLIQDGGYLGDSLEAIQNAVAPSGDETIARRQAGAWDRLKHRASSYWTTHQRGFDRFFSAIGIILPPLAIAYGNTRGWGHLLEGAQANLRGLRNLSWDDVEARDEASLAGQREVALEQAFNQVSTQMIRGSYQSSIWRPQAHLRYDHSYYLHSFYNLGESVRRAPVIGLVFGRTRADTEFTAISIAAILAPTVFLSYAAEGGMGAFMMEALSNPYTKSFMSGAVNGGTQTFGQGLASFGSLAAKAKILKHLQTQGNELSWSFISGGICGIAPTAYNRFGRALVQRLPFLAHATTRQAAEHAGERLFRSIVAEKAFAWTRFWTMEAEIEVELDDLRAALNQASQIQRSRRNRMGFQNNPNQDYEEYEGTTIDHLFRLADSAAGEWLNHGAETSAEGLKGLANALAPTVQRLARRINLNRISNLPIEGPSAEDRIHAQTLAPRFTQLGYSLSQINEAFGFEVPISLEENSSSLRVKDAEEGLVESSPYRTVAIQSEAQKEESTHTSPEENARRMEELKGLLAVLREYLGGEGSLEDIQAFSPENYRSLRNLVIEMGGNLSSPEGQELLQNLVYDLVSRNVDAASLEREWQVFSNALHQQWGAVSRTSQTNTEVSEVDEANERNVSELRIEREAQNLARELFSVLSRTERQNFEAHSGMILGRVIGIILENREEGNDHALNKEERALALSGIAAAVAETSVQEFLRGLGFPKNTVARKLEVWVEPINQYYAEQRRIRKASAQSKAQAQSQASPQAAIAPVSPTLAPITQSPSPSTPLIPRTRAASSHEEETPENDADPKQNDASQNDEGASNFQQGKGQEDRKNEEKNPSTHTDGRFTVYHNGASVAAASNNFDDDYIPGLNSATSHSTNPSVHPSTLRVLNALQGIEEDLRLRKALAPEKKMHLVEMGRGKIQNISTEAPAVLGVCAPVLNYLFEDPKSPFFNQPPPKALGFGVGVSNGHLNVSEAAIGDEPLLVAAYSNAAVTYVDIHPEVIAIAQRSLEEGQLRCYADISDLNLRTDLDEEQKVNLEIELDKLFRNLAHCGMLDLSPSESGAIQLNIARVKKQLKLEEGDILSYPLEKESWPFILAINILTYLSKANKGLAYTLFAILRLLRALQAGGVLVISLENTPIIHEWLQSLGLKLLHVSPDAYSSTLNLYVYQVSPQGLKLPKELELRMEAIEKANASEITKTSPSTISQTPHSDKNNTEELIFGQIPFDKFLVSLQERAQQSPASLLGIEVNDLSLPEVQGLAQARFGQLAPVFEWLLVRSSYREKENARKVASVGIGLQIERDSSQSRLRVGDEALLIRALLGPLGVREVSAFDCNPEVVEIAKTDLNTATDFRGSCGPISRALESGFLEGSGLAEAYQKMCTDLTDRFELKIKGDTYRFKIPPKMRASIHFKQGDIVTVNLENNYSIFFLIYVLHFLEEQSPELVAFTLARIITSLESGGILVFSDREEGEICKLVSSFGLERKTEFQGLIPGARIYIYQLGTKGFVLETTTREKLKQCENAIQTAQKTNLVTHQEGSIFSEHTLVATVLTSIGAGLASLCGASPLLALGIGFGTFSLWGVLSVLQNEDYFEKIKIALSFYFSQFKKSLKLFLDPYLEILESIQEGNVFENLVFQPAAPHPFFGKMGIVFMMGNPSTTSEVEGIKFRGYTAYSTRVFEDGFNALKKGQPKLAERVRRRIKKLLDGDDNILAGLYGTPFGEKLCKIRIGAQIRIVCWVENSQITFCFCGDHDSLNQFAFNLRETPKRTPFKIVSPDEVLKNPDTEEGGETSLEERGDEEVSAVFFHPPQPHTVNETKNPADFMQASPILYLVSDEEIAASPTETLPAWFTGIEAKPFRCMLVLAERFHEASKLAAEIALQEIKTLLATANSAGEAAHYIEVHWRILEAEITEALPSSERLRLESRLRQSDEDVLSLEEAQRRALVCALNSERVPAQAETLVTSFQGSADLSRVRAALCELYERHKTLLPLYAEISKTRAVLPAVETRSVSEQVEVLRREHPELVSLTHEEALAAKEEIEQMTGKAFEAIPAEAVGSLDNFWSASDLFFFIKLLAFFIAKEKQLTDPNLKAFGGKLKRLYREACLRLLLGEEASSVAQRLNREVRTGYAPLREKTLQALCCDAQSLVYLFMSCPELENISVPTENPWDFYSEVHIPDFPEWNILAKILMLCLNFNLDAELLTLFEALLEPDQDFLLSSFTYSGFQKKYSTRVSHLLVQYLLRRGKYDFSRTRESAPCLAVGNYEELAGRYPEFNLVFPDPNKARAAIQDTREKIVQVAIAKLQQPYSEYVSGRAGMRVLQTSGAAVSENNARDRTALTPLAPLGADYPTLAILITYTLIFVQEDAPSLVDKSKILFLCHTSQAALLIAYGFHRSWVLGLLNRNLERYYSKLRETCLNPINYFPAIARADQTSRALAKCSSPVRTWLAGIPEQTQRGALAVVLALRKEAWATEAVLGKDFSTLLGRVHNSIEKKQNPDAASLQRLGRYYYEKEAALKAAKKAAQSPAELLIERFPELILVSKEQVADTAQEYPKYRVLQSPEGKAYVAILYFVKQYSKKLSPQAKAAAAEMRTLLKEATVASAILEELSALYETQLRAEVLAQIPIGTRLVLETDLRDEGEKWDEALAFQRASARVLNQTNDAASKQSALEKLHQAIAGVQTYSRAREAMGRAYLEQKNELSTSTTTTRQTTVSTPVEQENFPEKNPELLFPDPETLDAFLEENASQVLNELGIPTDQAASLVVLLKDPAFETARRIFYLIQKLFSSTEKTASPFYQKISGFYREILIRLALGEAVPLVAASIDEPLRDCYRAHRDSLIKKMATEPGALKVVLDHCPELRETQTEVLDPWPNVDKRKTPRDPLWAYFSRVHAFLCSLNDPEINSDLNDSLFTHAASIQASMSVAELIHHFKVYIIEGLIKYLLLRRRILAHLQSRENAGHPAELARVGGFDKQFPEFEAAQVRGAHHSVEWFAASLDETLRPKQNKQDSGKTFVGVYVPARAEILAILALVEEASPHPQNSLLKLRLAHLCKAAAALLWIGLEPKIVIDVLVDQAIKAYQQSQAILLSSVDWLSKLRGRAEFNLTEKSTPEACFYALRNLLEEPWANPEVLGEALAESLRQMRSLAASLGRVEPVLQQVLAMRYLIEQKRLLEAKAKYDASNASRFFLFGSTEWLGAEFTFPTLPIAQVIERGNVGAGLLKSGEVFVLVEGEVFATTSTPGNHETRIVSPEEEASHVNIFDFKPWKRPQTLDENHSKESLEAYILSNFGVKEIAFLRLKGSFIGLQMIIETDTGIENKEIPDSEGMLYFCFYPNPDGTHTMTVYYISDDRRVCAVLSDYGVKAGAQLEFQSYPPTSLDQPHAELVKKQVHESYYKHNPHESPQVTGRAVEPSAQNLTHFVQKMIQEATDPAFLKVADPLAMGLMLFAGASLAGVVVITWGTWRLIKAVVQTSKKAAKSLTSLPLLFCAAAVTALGASALFFAEHHSFVSHFSEQINLFLASFQSIPYPSEFSRLAMISPGFNAIGLGFFLGTTLVAGAIEIFKPYVMALGEKNSAKKQGAVKALARRISDEKTFEKTIDELEKFSVEALDKLASSTHEITSNKWEKLLTKLIEKWIIHAQALTSHAEERGPAGYQMPEAIEEKYKKTLLKLFESKFFTRLFFSKRLFPVFLMGISPYFACSNFDDFANKIIGFSSSVVHEGVMQQDNNETASLGIAACNFFEKLSRSKNVANKAQDLAHIAFRLVSHLLNASPSTEELRKLLRTSMAKLIRSQCLNAQACLYWLEYISTLENEGSTLFLEAIDAKTERFIRTTAEAHQAILTAMEHVKTVGEKPDAYIQLMALVPREKRIPYLIERVGRAYSYDINKFYFYFSLLAAFAHEIPEYQIENLLGMFFSKLNARLISKTPFSRNFIIQSVERFVAAQWRRDTEVQERIAQVVLNVVVADFQGCSFARQPFDLHLGCWHAIARVLSRGRIFNFPEHTILFDLAERLLAYIDESGLERESSFYEHIIETITHLIGAVKPNEASILQLCRVANSLRETMSVCLCPPTFISQIERKWMEIFRSYFEYPSALRYLTYTLAGQAEIVVMSDDYLYLYFFAAYPLAALQRKDKAAPLTEELERALLFMQALERLRIDPTIINFYLRLLFQRLCPEAYTGVRPSDEMKNWLEQRRAFEEDKVRSRRKSVGLPASSGYDSFILESAITAPNRKAIAVNTSEIRQAYQNRLAAYIDLEGIRESISRPIGPQIPAALSSAERREREIFEIPAPQEKAADMSALEKLDEDLREALCSLVENLDSRLNTNIDSLRGKMDEANQKEAAYFEAAALISLAHLFHEHRLVFEALGLWNSNRDSLLLKISQFEEEFSDTNWENWRIIQIPQNS